MGFEINEKQLRIRYIRVVEKFLTRTISLLKLENFDKELFLKRTLKNYEDNYCLQLICSYDVYLLDDNGNTVERL